MCAGGAVSTCERRWVERFTRCVWAIALRHGCATEIVRRRPRGVIMASLLEFSVNANGARFNDETASHAHKCLAEALVKEAVLLTPSYVLVLGSDCTKAATCVWNSQKKVYVPNTTPRVGNCGSWRWSLDQPVCSGLGRLHCVETDGFARRRPLEGSLHLVDNTQATSRPHLLCYMLDWSD